MEKTYEPNKIEQKWYENWEKNHYFKPSGHGSPYCIMIPPPNVTGTLHMGHGFQYTLMDMLIRYHRMKGDNTLWQVGTDHAGIATQMIVERKLLEQGTSRHELGREAFIEKVWEWRGESGGKITQQMRSLGVSVDWDRECFTMDEQLYPIVQEAFVKLYDEGLIYRGKRLVNWDPKLKTAISDLEVLSQEESGSLWHLRYPLKNGEDYLIVATTRPETMLGDVAVAVHPEDDRYKHLIGQTILLPLAEREIPIIADDYVDPEFGSGCVKITPAHDFNDYQIGLRHKLPMINILNDDATLNEDVPKDYRGLDRFIAREKVISTFKDSNLLEKIEEHQLMVPRGEKSGEIIEPYLTDQWFVKVAPLVEPAIEVVKTKKVQFVPQNWEKTYFQWMENIEDWCISRQLWWGHRIPAWYDDENKIYVGSTEADVRKKYQLNDKIKLRQDNDVLDTWFSSALWPFSTLGGPEETDDIKTFYPTDVLVTGFDIIFFWVARMIMMGLKFMNKIPFHTVYITGLIRDGEGQKMSKSKGNIIDPTDLINGIDLESLIQKRTRNLMQPHLKKQIEKMTRKEYPNGISMYGTDALRFTYCALASTNRNVRFDLARIEGYRNFCNKLWNAARYVLMNTEGKDTGIDSSDIKYSLADRWILGKLQYIIERYTQYMENYRFDLLAQTIYEFIWHEYCDWYLELSKPILYDENAKPSLQRGTRKTLVTILETILRLLHPVMPYITEEIWQKVASLAGKKDSTIMLQPFPEMEKPLIDEEAITDTEWLKQIISGIRTIRSEMNISPQKRLPLLVHRFTETEKQKLEHHQHFLCSLAKLDSITFLPEESKVPPAATAIVGALELLIPMSGLIDKSSETSRLSKEIEKLKLDMERSEKKLNNPRFVDNAPDEIVKKERDRLDELQLSLNKLTKRLEQVEAL